MNSTVTPVTKRDVSQAVTQSCCRDRRDTPLWGVTFVTLTQPRTKLVPMPPFQSGQETVGQTCAFALCDQKRVLHCPDVLADTKRLPPSEPSERRYTPPTKKRPEPRSIVQTCRVISAPVSIVIYSELAKAICSRYGLATGEPGYVYTAYPLLKNNSHFPERDRPTSVHCKTKSCAGADTALHTRKIMVRMRMGFLRHPLEV